MPKDDKGREPEKAQGPRTEQTQPAEERGERLATGRAIYQGGKSGGPVPGATEQPTGGSESEKGRQ